MLSRKSCILYVYTSIAFNSNNTWLKSYLPVRAFTARNYLSRCCYTGIRKEQFQRVLWADGYELLSLIAWLIERFESVGTEDSRVDWKLRVLFSSASEYLRTFIKCSVPRRNKGSSIFGIHAISCRWIEWWKSNQAVANSFEFLVSFINVGGAVNKTQLQNWARDKSEWTIPSLLHGALSRISRPWKSPASFIEKHWPADALVHSAIPFNSLAGRAVWVSLTVRTYKSCGWNFPGL